MKLINILKQTLQEGRKNDYGCVMLFFDFPEINKIHDKINQNDVYIDKDDDSFGLEKESHTTLLFGLHKEVLLNKIKSILDKYTFSTCKIYNASLFENPKYDVLKFDVKGNNLHNCNKELKKLPYTSNFPDYHPHLTIGYLKKGMGKKYVNLFKDLEFELIPKYAIYSEPDGNKTKININID